MPCDVSAKEWLVRKCEDLEPIDKDTDETRAWFATLDGEAVFAKAYPSSRSEWAEVEQAIAGANLHRAILPLEQTIRCSDGNLHLYRRAKGDNLGDSDARTRFSRLPVRERADAVLDACDALATVCHAGFTIVDWYEGNMLYDFDAHRIWLFDWELCRPGDSFVLTMESNYGSSRLMAPEEFVRGSTIDQASLVFNVGRYVLLSLPEWAERLAPVLSRATYPARSGRFETVREFAIHLREAW